MSSSIPPSATTSAVATATVSMSTSPVPSSTPPTTPNNTTSLFYPEPTNNQNTCGRCSSQKSCFMYSGGFICQPFTSNNITSPPTPGVPAAWFLADNYPSVRYTMSVVNQTAGANCTTITTPPAMFYSALAKHIMTYDLGGYYLDLEGQYSSTLFQYRGNCADAFYCRPNNLPVSQVGTIDQFIQGNLPGTCQPLVAEGGNCLASSMCQGWHIAPDYTYNNDQFRCNLNTRVGDVNHPAGTCRNLGLGSGKVSFDDGSFMQQTARTYILSAMLLFCLAFLFLWYRRQKARQMQQQRMMMDAQGQPYYYDNTVVYLSRGGGVNRQPDDNDSELPAYGQHRRDERVTGPAAEEIGMYSFPSGPPPASPSPYPATSVRPTQHTYPFSMNHPAFINPTLPIPSGALYPPPQSPPPPPMSPPMSATEAEAAALSAAAAAAAVATPVPAHQPPVEEARQVVESGKPPAYDGVAPGSSGEKDPKRKEDEGIDPFEGSSSGSSARSTPDLERSKEKAGQDDQDSTRSGGSSRGPDSGRH
ncbi:hypothetical protein MVEG_09391 [Podila verticillata NRRL 6337]|nr:hypothetical protein MVEG_09391 [Podila verticillata NRRL 6337]